MRLLDLGYKEHFRVKHSANEFSKSGNPNNGIEKFWGLCKVRLMKFRGIKKDMFYLLYKIHLIPIYAINKALIKFYATFYL